MQQQLTVRNPKVSIVIPVYNGSNYLAGAIDSALAQTYKDIEVIVVNDGSNDGSKTEQIALSYGNKIRYLAKKNGGVASALNMGIRETDGEYISWLSHDDILLPRKIEEQLDFLNLASNDNLILYGDFEILDLLTQTSRIFNVAEIDNQNEIFNILYLLFGGAIHGCTLLIPKKCFAHVGLFNQALKTTQDYELWFKLVKNGYLFKHVRGVTIKTRRHAEQGTHTLSDKHEQELNELYLWALRLFEDEIRSYSYKIIQKLSNMLSERRLTKPGEEILRIWSKDRTLRFSLAAYADQFNYNIRRGAQRVINKVIPLISANPQRKP